MASYGPVTFTSAYAKNKTKKQHFLYCVPIDLIVAGLTSATQWKFSFIQVLF